MRSDFILEFNLLLNDVTITRSRVLYYHSHSLYVIRGGFRIQEKNSENCENKEILGPYGKGARTGDVEAHPFSPPTR